VAVSTHGERVMSAARQSATCAHPRQFTARVRDVANDHIVDELPASPTSTSADLGVVASGSALGRRR
jgi:hypothetical protein